MGKSDLSSAERFDDWYRVHARKYRISFLVSRITGWYIIALVTRRRKAGLYYWSATIDGSKHTEGPFPNRYWAKGRGMWGWYLPQGIILLWAPPPGNVDGANTEAARRRAKRWLYR